MALTSFLMCVILATALVHATDEVPSCGTPTIPPRISDSRIIGGTEAREHSWPWQVSLKRSSGSHYCGGSLLNENWILTAAHCKQSNTVGLTAGLGIHHLNSARQTINIAEQNCTTQYNSQTIDYDYCLLRLETPAELNDYVHPVCLPKASDEEEAKVFGPETPCFITGFGYSQYIKGQPAVIASTLQQAKANLITLEDCRRTWKTQTLTSRQQCVNMDGSTACMGDSGGPLVCRTDGAWRVYGSTSWGHYKCDVNGVPVVYARTTDPTMNEWIRENAGL